MKLQSKVSLSFSLLFLFFLVLALSISSSLAVQCTDVDPPIITIITPINNTIYDATVWYCALDAFKLTFTVNEPVSWMGYSLDNEANVTITGNTTVDTVVFSHQVIVYANDTTGNMGRSSPVYFSIKPNPPTSTTTTANSSDVQIFSWFSILFLILLTKLGQRSKKL